MIEQDTRLPSPCRTSLFRLIQIRLDKWLNVGRDESDVWTGPTVTRLRSRNRDKVLGPLYGAAVTPPGDDGFHRLCAFGGSSTAALSSLLDKVEAQIERE